METISYDGYNISMNCYCKAPLRISYSIGRYINSRLLLIIINFCKLFSFHTYSTGELYVLREGSARTSGGACRCVGTLASLFIGPLSLFSVPSPYVGMQLLWPSRNYELL